MTTLVLKNNIERKKLDALLAFLKSWGIEFEIKQGKKNQSQEFTLNHTIWEGTDIDAKELRTNAWNKSR